MKKRSSRDAALFVCAALVPCALFVLGVQSQKYQNLRLKVSELENRQRELIEENRRLVADISQLSSSARIERRAVEELGMHHAAASEIVRVEMKGAGQ